MTARLLLVAGWIAFSLATPLPAAQKLTDQAAIESAHEALSGYSQFPWYDEQQDQVRRVDVAAPRDVAARRSKWEIQPLRWSAPEWLKNLLEATFWLLLAIAILFVVYAMIRAMSGVNLFSLETADGQFGDAQRGDIDRVDDLPFSLARPQSDLLAEARRLYAAGEFGQAMIYLYSYQLVQLDRHHRIRLAKGKTNRQYLREARSQPELGELLRGSMVAFEEVFFGHHVLDRERFEKCWRRLDEFHQELEPVAV